MWALAVATSAMTVPTEKQLELSFLKYPHRFAGPRMVVSRSVVNSLKVQSKLIPFSSIHDSALQHPLPTMKAWKWKFDSNLWDYQIGTQNVHVYVRHWPPCSQFPVVNVWAVSRFGFTLCSHSVLYPWHCRAWWWTVTLAVPIASFLGVTQPKLLTLLT